MMKNLVQLESVIGDWVGHFYLANNTPLDIAEQMLLQYLQQLGKIKENVLAQQEAKKSASESDKEEKLVEQV